MYRGGRGGGMGSVVAGMIAIAIGIGVIVVSYQLAQPGGIYFVPVGLIASGFLAIFRGLSTPSATRRKRRSYARPARSTMNSNVALPQQVPRGYCWQCGRKVREGSAICYGCGAAQIHSQGSQPTSRPPGQPGVPPQPWHGPTYQPDGMQSPWAAPQDFRGRKNGGSASPWQ